MLSKLTTDMANISKLPNTVIGQATTLKAEFDKAGNEQIKTYINDTLTTEIDAEIANANNGLTGHKNDKNNPHEVTKEQVGLGNADNTSDLDKPISTAMQAGLDTKVDKVVGKVLSKNDFTDVLKGKLDGIEDNADVNIIETVNLNNTPLTVTNKTVNIDLNTELASLYKGVTYTALDGKLTFTKHNNTTTIIDLPLELIVESGTYDSVNKQIVLTLANSNTIDIPIGDLISDLYTKGETDTLLTGKVDKEPNKSLVSDTQITKLETIPSGSSLNDSFNAKVDKISGKQLSTEDYTTEEKEKLTSLTAINLGIVSNLNELDDIFAEGLYLYEYNGVPQTLIVSHPTVPLGEITQYMSCRGTLKDRYYYHEWSEWNTISCDFNPNEKAKLSALPTYQSLNTLLNNKVDKVAGKGLSANDFTTALKNKLDGDDGVDSQGIVFIESPQFNAMVEFTLNPKKEIYKTSIDSNNSEIWFNYNSADMAGINYRFELILELIDTDTHLIPSTIFWFNDNGIEVPPTFLIPPAIEYPHTINKFVFETFDGGLTWYGNQCYSVEVV